LVRAYVPNGPLPARQRERIIVAVSEVNGCRSTAWIHGAWRTFLGDTGDAEAEEAVLGYARACARAGRPLPVEVLEPALPAASLGAVRATVAHAEVTSTVWAAPVVVPLFATAAAMRAATLLAPPIPDIVMPDDDDANLLVHLLAQGLRVYLANAAVRLCLLRLPVTVNVGVRSGRTAATVRVGRGHVVLENDIADDVMAVVEGEVEPLLQLATGSIVRELRTIRIRPS
jgi:hypothetical protein